MRKVLILSVMLVLSISLSLYAQHALQASILIVKGDVSAGNESKGWSRVKVNDVIQAQDHIRCGSDGEVTFAIGESIVHLDGESEALISEFVDDENTEKVRISLLVGLITVKVKKLLKNDLFEVEMPTAVVGVRGTEFSVALVRDEVEVDVLEGVVDFMDHRNRTKMIRLKKYERVRFRGHQDRFPERVERLDARQKKLISEKMGKIRNIQKKHLKKRMEIKRKIQKKRVKR